MHKATTGVPFRPASRKVSLLGNDNLEVFAGNDHGLVARGVEATARKRFAASVLKRLKCLEHWSIVRPEDAEEVLRRAVAEVKVVRLRTYRGR